MLLKKDLLTLNKLILDAESENICLSNVKRFLENQTVENQQKLCSLAFNEMISLYYMRYLEAKSALHLAMDRKYYELAEFFMNEIHCNPDSLIEGHCFKTPYIFRCIDLGEVSSLRFLLENGANPCLAHLYDKIVFDENENPIERTQSITPPLYNAVSRNDVESCRLLLQFGAKDGLYQHSVSFPATGEVDVSVTKLASVLAKELANQSIVSLFKRHKLL